MDNLEIGLLVPLFGFGMTLSGGCGNKTLIRLWVAGPFGVG
jgi:hypothetical protein